MSLQDASARDADKHRAHVVVAAAAASARSPPAARQSQVVDVMTVGEAQGATPFLVTALASGHVTSPTGCYIGRSFVDRPGTQTCSAVKHKIVCRRDCECVCVRERVLRAGFLHFIKLF